MGFVVTLGRWVITDTHHVPCQTRSVTERHTGSESYTLAICFLVLEVPHKVGRKSTKVENVGHANVVTIGTVGRNVGLSPCHRFDTVASNKPMLATVFGHRINILRAYSNKRRERGIL